MLSDEKDFAMKAYSLDLLRWIVNVRRARQTIEHDETPRLYRYGVVGVANVETRTSA